MMFINIVSFFVIVITCSFTYIGASIKTIFMLYVSYLNIFVTI